MISGSADSPFSGGDVVRIAGLEPARITPLPPQSSASANSAICAKGPPIINQRAADCARRNSRSGLRARNEDLLPDLEFFGHQPRVGLQDLVRRDDDVFFTAALHNFAQSISRQ